MYLAAVKGCKMLLQELQDQHGEAMATRLVREAVLPLPKVVATLLIYLLHTQNEAKAGLLMVSLVKGTLMKNRWRIKSIPQYFHGENFSLLGNDTSPTFKFAQSQKLFMMNV